MIRHKRFTEGRKLKEGLSTEELITIMTPYVANPSTDSQGFLLGIVNQEFEGNILKVKELVDSEEFYNELLEFTNGEIDIANQTLANFKNFVSTTLV